jgi:hypothetical protein
VTLLSLKSTPNFCTSVAIRLLVIPAVSPVSTSPKENAIALPFVSFAEPGGECGGIWGGIFDTVEVEVLAIHQLDRVFNLLNRPIRVKRGALFSRDDAKNSDLIFVGSPSENLTLLDTPGTEEFVFRRLDSGPRKGDLAVLNVHPLADEPKTFLATPANQPTTEDYAVVSLLPGLDPSLHPDSWGGTPPLAHRPRSSMFAGRTL